MSTTPTGAAPPPSSVGASAISFSRGGVGASTLPIDAASKQGWQNVGGKEGGECADGDEEEIDLEEEEVGEDVGRAAEGGAVECEGKGEGGLPSSGVAATVSATAPTDGAAATTAGTRKRHRTEADDEVEESGASFLKPTHVNQLHHHHHQQQQASRPLPQCNTSTLFVGGLHPRVADVHLHKLFGPYGNVRRVSVVLHGSNEPQTTTMTAHGGGGGGKGLANHHHQQHQLLRGRPKGYAFVEYDSIPSAQLAMSRIDGRELLGRTLVVRPARSKKLTTTAAEVGGTEERSSSTAAAATTTAQRRAVESRIEAVKRRLEEKRRRLAGLGAGR